MFKTHFHSIFLAALLISVTVTATAGQSELESEILIQDKALFDAFNQCDLGTWKTLLDENVEFYQDNDNPTFTREALIPSFLDRCDANGNARLTRRLISEKSEVHPLKNFGAVQFGYHEFTLATENGFEVVAKPRFVHVWKLENGKWRITRVVSYDH